MGLKSLESVYFQFNKHSKTLIILSLMVALFSASFKMGVGIGHPKFVPEVIKVFFNFIALNAAVLFTVKNVLYFTKYKMLSLEVFLTFAITALIFNTVVNYNTLLNNLVYFLYPTPLMTSILDDAVAIPWAFVVVGINLVISVILYTLDKRKVSGLGKIVHNGLLVYGFLSIAVWFFTHFSYVGSNYIYMTNNLKVIDSLVENHTKYGQPYPKGFQVREYNTYQEFKNQSLELTQKAFMEEKRLHPDLQYSRDLTMLSQWFNNIESQNFGKKPSQSITVESVHDFSSWVFFIFNFPQYKITTEKWLGCDLIFPPKVNSRTNLIKHGLFYAKNVDGKFYTYIEFDKTFKEKGQNLVFNVAYTLFHFIYWLCFLYLIKFHQKRVFKREVTV